MGGWVQLSHFWWTDGKLNLQSRQASWAGPTSSLSIHIDVSDPDPNYFRFRARVVFRWLRVVRWTCVSSLSIVKCVPSYFRFEPAVVDAKAIYTKVERVDARYSCLHVRCLELPKLPNDVDGWKIQPALHDITGWMHASNKNEYPFVLPWYRWLCL